MPRGVYIRKEKPTSKVEVSCFVCGKIKLIYPHVLKIGQGKTCSRKCSAIRLIPQTKKRLHTPDIRQKIVVSLTGKKLSQEHREKLSVVRRSMNIVPWNKGLTAIGDKRVAKSVEAAHEAVRGTIAWNKGKKMPQITGKNHYGWKGTTPETSRIRASIEYKLWREAVFMRDNFTCKTCNKKGGFLEADHIKPFAYYPELRFAIDNGQTLCRVCHHQKTWKVDLAFRYPNAKSLKFDIIE